MTLRATGTRVAHGLHREPDLVSDELGRTAALLTLCPDDAVLSGVTAARLQGMWLPPLRQSSIEVIVHAGKGSPTARSYNKRPEIRARRQHLDPREVTLLEGLPVTTEARTWLDLAARFVGGDLLALGDSVLRGDSSAADLAEVVLRARHRPGVRNARQTLPMLDGRSRSRPESFLRWLLLDAGLPCPAVNVPIRSDLGEWLCEPDLSYDDVRLGIEYNGADHEAPGRMQKDITRTTDVEDRGGWRIITFGKVQVFRRPDVVVRRVRTLRAERARLTAFSGPRWA